MKALTADYPNLELTILNYIARCIARGKTTELEEIGIDVATMQLIAKMNVDELAMMNRPKANKVIKRIQLDRGALKEVAAQANQTGAQKYIIKRLIQAKANHELLNHFFSLTKAEVATLRKIHNVDALGRPKGTRRFDAMAKILVLDRLTGFIEGYGLLNARNPIYQAQAILETAELTQFPVTHIWKAAQAEELAGRFKWAGVYQDIA